MGGKGGSILCALYSNIWRDSGNALRYLGCASLESHIGFSEILKRTTAGEITSLRRLVKSQNKIPTCWSNLQNLILLLYVRSPFTDLVITVCIPTAWVYVSPVSNGMQYEMSLITATLIIDCPALPRSAMSVSESSGTLKVT